MRTGGWLLLFGGIAMLVVTEYQSSRMLAALSAARVHLQKPLVYSVSQESLPRLIHVTEMLHPARPLKDPELGLELDAVRVTRRVWMLQWTESKIVSRGPQERLSTHHELNWSNQLIPSDVFLRRAGHENPRRMPLETQTFSTTATLVGAHRVPANLSTGLLSDRPIAVLEDDLKTLNETWAKRLTLEGGSLFARVTRGEDTPGDFYVSYDAMMSDQVSVIAEERGGLLVPWNAGGVQLFLAQEGAVSADVMIRDSAVEWRLHRDLIRIVAATMVLLAVAALRRASRIPANGGQLSDGLAA